MKKSVTYRISQETEETIKWMSQTYHCSKTDVIESCIRIIFENGIAELLEKNCIERYLNNYGIEMEYSPNMSMIEREASKVIFEIN